MSKQHTFEKLHSKFCKETLGLDQQTPAIMAKGKYYIYCQIKKQYHREKYLYKICDNNIRKNITGIRCASNVLPINALRKLNIKREFRICSLCSAQKLGTEMHILMECVNDDISKLRSGMFNKIDKISPQFKMLSAEQQFIYVLRDVKEMLHGVYIRCPSVVAA